jgi:hypothetical protein
MHCANVFATLRVPAKDARFLPLTRADRLESAIVSTEISGYQLVQIFLRDPLKIRSMSRARDLEKAMKRAALVLLMIGSLTVTGEASAHGYGGGGGDGGAIVGALIGGAVLGAIVGSVANAAPVYAAPAPVYAQPVYAQPVYAQPVYAQPAPPPPNYCYDDYRRAYYPCGPGPRW